MKNNEVKLGFLKKWGLKISFGLIETLINSIKNRTARVMLHASFIPAKDIINVVTDNVPDNKIQLQELFLNKSGEYIANYLDGAKVLVMDSQKLSDEMKTTIVEGLNALSSELKEGV